MPSNGKNASVSRFPKMKDLIALVGLKSNLTQPKEERHSARHDLLGPLDKLAPNVTTISSGDSMPELVHAARTAAQDGSTQYDGGGPRDEPSRQLFTRTNTGTSDQSKMRDEISKELDKEMIGLEPKNYLPEEKLKYFVTEHRVKSVLNCDAEDLITYITQSAPRTFLATLLTLDNDLLDAMHAFYEHGFDDRHLLVDSINDADMPNWGLETWACSTCQHGSNSTGDNQHTQAFNHGFWSHAKFKTFYEKQSYFKLQMLDVQRFRYDHIDDNQILPIRIMKETSTRAGRGGDAHEAGTFSQVQRAEILTSHLKDCPCLSFCTHTPNEATKDIAVKILKPPFQRSKVKYNIKKEWEKEVSALKAFNESGHRRIVRGLAAFCWRGQYYILLEWANRGTLQDLWDDCARPEFSGVLLKQVFRELHGLAEALHYMHEKPRAELSTTPSREGSILGQSELRESDTTDFAMDGRQLAMNLQITEDPITRPRLETEVPDATSSAMPGILLNNEVLSQVVSGSKGQPEYWRHGDVKPPNILRHVDADTEEPGRITLGTLKLADLGRAKQHLILTHMREDVEHDNWLTRNYEPPDFHINKDRTTSRLYDIWSLGCVFFETVVWMLYGADSLVKYKATQSIELDRAGSFYWSQPFKGSPHATLSQEAGIWMDNIIHREPECRKESALLDLMHIIKDKMLVVQLPRQSNIYEVGCRANAETLCHDLRRIVDRAEADPAYLFAGLDRSNNHAPASGTQRPSLIVKTAAPAATPDIALIPAPKQYGTYLLPSDSGRSQGKTGATTIARRNQYTHPMTKKWTHMDDDEYATKTLRALWSDRTMYDQLTSAFEAKARICKFCRAFNPIDPDFFPSCSLKTINLRKKSCELCDLIATVALKSGIENGSTIHIDRQGSRLRINGKDEASLRVCRSTGTPRYEELLSDAIPIGLPGLPEPGDGLHLKLIREWLKDCDEHHGCLPQGAQTCPPKRLLRVDTNPEDEYSPLCRLVEIANLGPKREELQYFALSHPWGSADAEPLKLTKSNMKELMNGFSADILPDTLKDTVTVVLGLGHHYVWIDSLCIRQASEHDEGEFLEEAKRMQEIYSSAYCVIAASSATGMDSGLLSNRKPRAVKLSIKENREISAPGGEYYISNVVDDFVSDVEAASLSGRGWVFQERALARRTIFFTENQTYFECGKDIRCETMTKIRSDDAAFLGDPEFPKFGTKGQPMGASLFLFTGLYQHYSRLSFSHDHDKPVAIAGLEQRLTDTFGIKSGAGVFAHRSGRWLLWERPSAVESLKPIDFSKGRIRTPAGRIRAPPSWSWMSYIGEIAFIDIPKRSTVWNNDLILNLTGDATTSWLYSKDDLTLKGPVLQISDEASSSIAASLAASTPRNQRTSEPVSLTLDVVVKESHLYRHFVVIGTNGSRAYVLVVSPHKDEAHAHSSSASALEFKRMGAGWIPNDMVHAAKVIEKSCIIV